MEVAALHSDQQTLVCPEESNIAGLAAEIDRIDQNQGFGTLPMRRGHRALEELYSVVEHILGLQYFDRGGANSVIAKECFPYTAN
jgi:hypothetical protein